MVVTSQVRTLPHQQGSPPALRGTIYLSFVLLLFYYVCTSDDCSNIVYSRSSSTVRLINVDSHLPYNTKLHTFCVVWQEWLVNFMKGTVNTRFPILQCPERVCKSWKTELVAMLDRLFQQDTECLCCYVCIFPYRHLTMLFIFLVMGCQIQKLLEIF